MGTESYVLAVDYGDKRVGLAIGHTVARLPEPLVTIENSSDLAANIGQAIRGREVIRLVVGIPRNMDGSLGAQAEKCREFGETLARQLQLPVVYVEEALSSVEAAQYLDGGREGLGLDAAAAAVILDRYFAEGGEEA